MDKKALQRERMKRYFIDATKEIIKTKGLSEVSVRNVADAAGYSYATMYNYFSDLNDLLWHATIDFVEEMASLLGDVYRSGKDPADLLKSGYRTYMEYYLANPAIFRFIFHSDLGPPSPDVESRLKVPLIGQKQEAVLKECIAQGLISANDVPIVADILVVIVHGLLLMHFASEKHISESELFQKLERDIDFVIKRNPGFEKSQ